MTSAAVESRTENRISWLDTLRGIAIILVLAGHAPLPPEAKALVYSFHMPLFFLLAGLFFNPQKHAPSFLKDKAKRLLLPYFAFAFLSYGFWLAIRPFSGQAGEIDILTPLAGTFYGVGTGDWLTHNPPLWFLPCLFLALMFVYAAARYLGVLMGMGLFFMAMLGFQLLSVEPFRLPWSFEIALIAAGFTGAGCLLRKPLLESPGLSAWQLIGWFVLWLLAATVNTDLNLHHVDLNNAAFGNIILFYLAAFAGIRLMFAVAAMLGNIPALSAIGKRTMPVFCMHMLVYLVITAAFKLTGFPIALTSEKLAEINPAFNPWLAVLAYVIPGLLVPLALAYAWEWLRKQKRQPQEMQLAPST